MSIARKPETVLEASSPAEEGDEVAMSGCVPSGEGCYRVEGVVRNLFEKDGETVKGVWLTASEYSKMVGGKTGAPLDGYSGTPVLDVSGKVA